MTGQYVGFRFGEDFPSRIATSTSLLLEGNTVPGELMYQPLIPFYPTIVSGDGTSTTPATTSDGFPLWTAVPSRVDLAFYVGDDVVIPLFFNDPSIPDDDRALNYQWFAQIRMLQSYRSTFIADFITDATFNTGTTEDDEYTKVEMFLPRSRNTHAGIYQWEIYSLSPDDYSRFPKPDDVDPADWPPPDTVKTWLYGECRIAPRTASILDWPTTGAGTSGGGAVPAVITSGGFVVGPNGRVP